MSIEETFAKLDAILEKMGSGELNLEESFKSYEEGMALLKSCNAQLDLVEKKIQVIQENGETHDLSDDI